MTSAPVPVVAPWLWAQTLGETFAAGLDPLGVGHRQRDARLARLIDAARAGSPFYRERMAALPAARPRLIDIAPVGKAELMSRFDDWATDRRITRAGVERFVSDPARLADAYLGQYLVWTSSGTSGAPGIFVQDAPSLAAFDALDALRLRGVAGGLASLAPWNPAQRYAFVAATGGHFAGGASVERLRRIGAASIPPLLQWLAPEIRAYSVQTPLRELARQLQDWAPTVLITYPSCAAALAQLQSEGALQLKLSEVWVGGEQLGAEQRARIRGAFGCTLRNNYGASEFFSIACECLHGQLHLNEDWVILEPVDEWLHPVPIGQASHSVLLTNLANRAQPLLRYRLDDSLRFAAQRCPCGSAFAVIEVQGRCDHTLVLSDARGRAVTLLPLALMTVIEEGAQVTQFQLLATGAAALELRFEAGQPDPAAAFARANEALAVYLAQHGLANVTLAHGSAAPLRQPRSGKLLRVVAGGGG